MDRDELLEAIRKGPILLTMNDGSSHKVDSIDDILVGDLTAYILVRGDDQKLRAKHLSLVCMTSVEELQQA